MNKFTMVVSKKEDGKYVKQGDVAVFYPLLNELGLEVEAKELDEEGFPVYGDDKVQFVFDAMLAAVKAQARNKLQSGTALLKDGCTIAETIEQLLESGSGNKGEALAIVREFLVSFKTWLAEKSGKTAKVQEAILNLAANRKSLALNTESTKDKFMGYLSQYVESLNEEIALKFSRPLEALESACNTEELDIG